MNSRYFSDHKGNVLSVIKSVMIAPAAFAVFFLTKQQQSLAFVVPVFPMLSYTGLKYMNLHGDDYSESTGSFALPPTSPSPLKNDFLRSFANQVRRVQGGNTLRTWDFLNADTQRVQVGARGSGGRPVTSRIEYWHTPSYIPFQVTAHTEDGLQRPIDCIIETPKHPKTIAMYNTASQQMPFDAAVDETGLISPYDAIAKNYVPNNNSNSNNSSDGNNVVEMCCDVVQGGGMIRYYTFDSDVDSIAVYIRSPEYNMKSKLEMTTGPNSVRQTYEVYCSSGYKTPFYAVLQTPGNTPHTLRIINQNSIEFPFDAYVMPHSMNTGMNKNYDDDMDDDRVLKPRSHIMGSW